MAVTEHDILLAKWITGDADLIERASIDKWIAAGEDNARYAEGLQRIWKESQHLATTSVVDEKQAWTLLRRRMDEDLPLKAKDHSIALMRLQSKKWMSIAAAVFIALVAAAIILYNHQSKKDIAPASLPTVKTNTTNAVTSDTLPDGTIVQLYPKATITCAADFNSKQRNTQLSGTAFFLVTHNSTKPFRIAVKDIVITDIGTSFLVRDTGNILSIVVATGIVEISNRANAVKLSAHDSLLVREDKTWIINGKENNHADTTGPEKEKSAQTIRLQKHSKIDIPADEYQKQLTAMKDILHDLIRNHVVKNMDEIEWVGLSETELIVNGKQQTDTLQQAFKRKYLLTRGEGYYYGPVKMHGKGYFFDSTDLKK